MRRGAFTWGLILVVLGGLLLANQFGLLPSNWLGLFWPVLIILLGVRAIVGGFRSRPAEKRLSLPLADARSARIVLHHGAGRMTLADGAAPGVLLEGEFAGGVRHREQRSGDMTDVKLEADDDAWRGIPWVGGNGLDWNVRVTGTTPLSLDIEAGANEMRLDLTRLPVQDLRIQTGASSTDVLLPATAGATRVKVEAGAASVRLAVPIGVGVRIHGTAGLGALDIAPRFARFGNEWRSADYDIAANRVDMDLEVGVGAIRVS